MIGVLFLFNMLEYFNEFKFKSKIYHVLNNKTEKILMSLLDTKKDDSLFKQAFFELMEINKSINLSKEKG